MKKASLLALVILLLLLTACLGSDPQTPEIVVVTSTLPPPVPTQVPEPTETTVVEPTPTEEPVVVETGAVSTLEDVQEATIRIEAQGNFVDPAGEESSVAGSGSGFIIDPEGIAVTNHHVAGGAALLKVWVGGGSETYNAQLLGVSECSDLAIIDIEGSGFPYLEWYEGEIKPGLDVYAAGFPLGEPEYTLTRGIVSKAKTPGETSWASVDAVLSHDATINPGNSGGPLVTREGQVVGVNYRSRDDFDQYFAIAPDEALPILERLRADEDIDSIGVNGEAVVYDEGLSGVWVSSVEAGSPADGAGIQGGDIVVELEDLELALDGTLSDYCDILRSHTADDTMNLQIVRFATEEVWEGQLNGEPLALAFSFAQEGREDVSDEGTDQDQTPEEYVRVDDDLGAIAMEVPASWNDIDSSPYLDEGGQAYAAKLTAAPDMANFLVDGPGVAFIAGLLEPGEFNADVRLDNFDFSDTCQTYEGRADYQDALYTGRYDQYADCGPSGGVIFVVAAAPEDQAFYTAVVAQALTSADLDAVDHVFDTFKVVGALPGATGAAPQTDSGTNLASLQVVNEADATVYALYISPSDSDSWGEDWLGQRVVEIGQSLTISGIPEGAYDIRAVTEDGDGLGTVFLVPLSGEIVFTVPGLATLPDNAVIQLEEGFPDSNENGWGLRGQGEFVDQFPPSDGQLCSQLKGEYRIALDWYQPYQAEEFFAQTHCYLNVGDSECAMAYGSDDTNFYWFAVEPSEQVFRLGLVKDGEWQDDPIAETSSFFIPSAPGWLYLAMSREGNVLSVYVNGVKIGEADASQLASGRIGIGGASQDNVPVTLCHDDLSIWRFE